MSRNLLPFQLRNKAITTLRKYFEISGLSEAFTPSLVKSGALEPYLDTIRVDYQKYHLPTSPEFSLKKALSLEPKPCPGIYEIAHAFRNEPHSNLHSPEFTMVEWYRRDCKYTDLKNDIIEIIRKTGEITEHQTSFVSSPIDITFSEMFSNVFKEKPTPDWSYKDYHNVAVNNDIISSYVKNPDHTVGNNILSTEKTGENNRKEINQETGTNKVSNKETQENIDSRESKKKQQSDKGSQRNTMNDAQGIELFSVLYDVCVQRFAIESPGLLFISEFPEFVRGMAAISETGWAERMEVVLGGVELANAYQECSNSNELLTVWKKNNEIRIQKGKIEHPIDNELINCTSDMKGVSGIALGLERLLMIVFEIPNIQQFHLPSFK